MSNDLNHCEFIGRLGGDVDTRYMTNGKAVSSFSIAVGSQWKDKSGAKQESTEWVSCTAFDKIGEICGEYLKKGSQVYVSGRMKTDKYEKDGQTRYSTKIVIENMQMLGGKSEQSDSKPKESAPAKHHPKGAFDDFESDSIPF
jgi:single-strand DNA-binding protein